jgi:hypothetical protein
VKTTTRILASISAFLFLFSSVVYSYFAVNAIKYNSLKIVMDPKTGAIGENIASQPDIPLSAIIVIPGWALLMACVFVIIFIIKRKNLFLNLAAAFSLFGAIIYIIIPKQLLIVSYYMTYRFFFSLNLISIYEKMSPAFLPDLIIFYMAEFFLITVYISKIKSETSQKEHTKLNTQ